MLTIPLPSPESLQVFKDKKIVLYAFDANQAPVAFLNKAFKHFGFDVVAVCSEKKCETQKLIKDMLKGVYYVPPEDLLGILEKHENVLVQCISFEPRRMEYLKKKIQKLGLQCSPFAAGALCTTFESLWVFHDMRNTFKYFCKKQKWKYGESKQNVKWKQFQRKTHKNPIVICLPPKTADLTIQYTFQKANEKSGTAYSAIEYINLWHSPARINRNVCEKKLGTLKVLVAVREPISQNLSILYQRVASGENITRLCFSALESNLSTSKTHLIDKYEQLFKEQGNNMQIRWNVYSDIYTNASSSACRIDAFGLIQLFFLNFKSYVLDITAYPFNKEKGYTIIKEGNTEVFVYQLEKLNSLVPELSAWVGVPFDKLEKGNAAEDKWIADSYKQAQKEIKITQEYFDKCFDEPYVKHCYSEADIEKFKARWRPHIKKDA